MVLLVVELSAIVSEQTFIKIAPVFSLNQNTVCHVFKFSKFRKMPREIKSNLRVKECKVSAENSFVYLVHSFKPTTCVDGRLKVQITDSQASIMQMYMHSMYT